MAGQTMVQDADSYQALLDRAHMETLAAIREGIVSAEHRELKPVSRCLQRCKPSTSMVYKVRLTGPAESERVPRPSGGFVRSLR